MDHIVIVDPGGTPAGSVITESEKPGIEAKGGVTLPCYPKHLIDSGVGGFEVREHGRGLILESLSAQMFAPMVLFADPDCRKVHWAMGIEFGDPSKVTGSLGLTADTRQMCGEKLDVSSSDTFVLKPTKAGRAILKGSATIRPHHPGLYTFAWYGAGAGARVMWTALTATP